VRHNNFKFTIRFVDSKTREKGFLNEYIQLCCNGMYQDCTEPEEILTTEVEQNIYITYMTLIVKDYGVPEVGVDLVASWIKQLYEHCDGFIVDTVIIHPKTNPPAMGAIVQWDYTNNCPIIKVITS